MGLAFEGLQKVGYIGPDVDVDMDTEDGKYVRLFTIAGVPDRSDGMKPGWYMRFGERFNWSNTPYSWYGDWRAALGAMVGVDVHKLHRMKRPPKTGPFIELLNYADNQGFFGPTTSTKLLSDFESHRPHAVAFAAELDKMWRAGGKPLSITVKGSHRPLRGSEPGTQFLELYDAWTAALRVASPEGVLHLH